MQRTLLPWQKAAKIVGLARQSGSICNGPSSNCRFVEILQISPEFIRKILLVSFKEPGKNKIPNVSQVGQVASGEKRQFIRKSSCQK